MHLVFISIHSNCQSLFTLLSTVQQIVKLVEHQQCFLCVYMDAQTQGFSIFLTTKYVQGTPILKSKKHLYTFTCKNQIYNQNIYFLVC